MLYKLRFITLSFLLFFTTVHPEEQELTDAIFPRTNPYRIGDIYQILKVLDRVFTKKDIKYWIDFGTLLGAERHGGIIPWDDDADVCVRVKDFAKIDKLTEAFAKYGLVLTKREPQPWKLHFPGQLHYCVDIFFIADVPNSPDGELTFHSTWAGHWYLSDVEPRRRIWFGPIAVNAPRSAWRRLSEQYGPDCMEKAMFHSHIYGDLPQKVTIVDFSPAEYLIDPNHRITKLD
jgi:lipopolysaccharide cholinephosphotransferase